MRYVGSGTNQFYIGRDMGWGTIAQTNFYGNVYLNNSLFLKNTQQYDDNNSSLIPSNINITPYDTACETQSACESTCNTITNTATNTQTNSE
jgi:hypothetical protein